jgi:gliding motility-associated-like protein
MKSKIFWIFLLFFPLFSLGQSIQGNSTVCVGSSTTLSCNACGIPPTSPTSAWSSSNSSVASIDVNGMVTGLNAGTVTITYTDNGGSTVTASFTVGAIPTLVNNGSITYFCQDNINQNIGFTSNPSFANNSIKWYDSNLSPIIPNPSAITVDCNIPQNDTNYISQVSPLGCEGPKSEVVTIVVATPAAPVTQDLDYCVGDNAPALTAQADIGNTLQWFKSTSPNTVTNSINPSTSNPGQETWLVRQIKQVPINKVCIGPKSSLTVTTHANPNPPSVTTTSFTYCIDDPAIQLAATPDAGHQLIWYGPGNTQSLTAPTPPTSTPGVFTYNVTQQNTLAQNCESTSITITVTVLDKAQTPTFSGVGVLPVEYCVNDASIPLSASSSSPGVLIWYNEDGTLTSSNFGVGGAPTPLTNANAVGTVNYKVILDPTSPNLCPSDTLIIPVVVHPNPVITTSNQSVCEGGSVTLSATGAGSGGSYYWNGGVVNNSAITVTPQVTTTYTVTGTDQYGCQGTEDATVTVLDLPNAPSTPSTNETLCQEVGTYIPSVTAGAGNSLTWYASNGTSVISGPPSIDKNTLGTYTYYVSQTNSDGCESEKLQIIINIVEVPPAPSTNNVSYCKDESANSLVAAASSGYTLQWYDSDGTTVLSSAPTPQTTSTGPTTYYVSQITNNNCESPKASITVTINDLPIPPTATPNAFVYCLNDIATTLSATALSGNSLKWYGTDATAVLSNAPTPPTSSSGNTNYYVSQVNGQGCESSKTSINIDVKPAVAMPIASPGNQIEYCENEFATALVASGSGGDLIWYNSDGTLTNTNFGVGGSPTPSTASSAIGTTQYYVVQQSLITGCDSDPLYVDVEVYANPTITTTSTVSSCAGEAVTLNGNGAGTGGSYSWDGGVVDGISFVPPFSNTTTTFTVTGTDVNGCQNTATATLTVNSNPNAPTVIAASYSYCKDAIATPLLANASFNHTLVWYNSDGVSALTAPFTPPTSTTGTFTYYVSQIDNSTGCESPTESIDVIVGIGIPSPITYDRSVCRNDFSTLLTATKLPGNTLNWFDPNGNALSFAPIYNTLIPGTTSYYVSQYDPVTGCESPQDTIDVVVNDLPNISAGTDFEICLGESTIVSASGAGIGGSYSWSSGLSDGVSFDPTATSTYTVTGTDANGCSAADDITITVNTIPSSPTIDPNSQTTFITGSVSSVLSAIALPGFTLTWYNSDGTLVNGTGSAPTPSTATTNVGTSEYLVTQTSTSGCESAPLTVQIVVLGVNVSNDTTICLTDTAQLLVNTYSTNTSTFNSTGYTFIGTYNGSDYYISPIDTSWSEVRSRAISDGGDLVNITDSAENYFVTQGLMPYSSTSFGPYYYMGIYQDLSSTSYAEPSGGWFNIDSTLVSHTNWKPGEPNNLFGTEHFGEIVIDSVTQVEFWNDVPDTQSNKYGVIEVPTSNSPEWSYLWSTGDTSSTINVNPSVDTQYWVAISDGNNTWYDSVNVTVNLLDINITQTDTILCAGDSSGTLGVAINPGNGPYQYLWNTGSTLDSLNNVTVGTYSVIVTDAMGCSASDAINIVSPNSMTLTTQSISNYNGFDISCSGEADAMAYADANGGTPGYIYSWSNGATGDTVSSLSFGTYFVTVIDSNGCSTLDTLILTEPSPLALNISSSSNVFGNQIDCYGDSTGILFSVLAGGVGGYSYTWNNGSTLDSIYNLGAGTYWVTAQDANGCTLTDTITLTQPSLPFTTTASTQSNFNGFGISCNGANDGIISAAAQGSNAPYTYAWSNGVTTSSQSNLVQGTYSVVVTDSLGCISNANVVITEPSLLTYSYIIDDVSCYLGQNGSIEIIPQGGVMPYDIQWFNGADSSVLDSLGSGFYAFNLTDQNNCLVIDSVEIYEPAELEITVDTIQPTCERIRDGEIDAFIYGGTYPYSYTLNGSSVDLPLDSVAVGNYVLTVEDSNSCTQTIAFNLTPLQPSCFMIPNMYSPNYDGYNDVFTISHSSWSSYTMNIYNSIGQLVYSGSSSTPYWDGITNGNPMPTGDYYYQLITNEGEVIYGYVTLIR